MYLHSYIAIVPLVDFYGSFCITVVRSFSLGMVVGQCRFTDFATDFHFFSLFYCDTVEVVIAFLPPPPSHTHTRAHPFRFLQTFKAVLVLQRFTFPGIGRPDVRATRTNKKTRTEKIIFFFFTSVSWNDLTCIGHMFRYINKLAGCWHGIHSLLIYLKISLINHFDGFFRISLARILFNMCYFFKWSN